VTVWNKWSIKDSTAQCSLKNNENRKCGEGQKVSQVDIERFAFIPALSSGKGKAHPIHAYEYWAIGV